VDELDKKLEPKLREAQVLAPNAFLKDACHNFIERVACVPLFAPATASASPSNA
jgi:hypothetical protein